MTFATVARLLYQVRRLALWTTKGKGLCMGEREMLLTTSVWGQLGGQAEDRWEGHRVWVGFDELSRRDENSPEDGTWRAAVRQGDVGPDGRFDVELPALSQIRGPVSVAVIAPNWSVITRHTLAIGDLDRPLLLIDFNRDDAVSRRRAIRQARSLAIPA